MAVNYSNSSLVNYTKISPNKNTTRVHKDYNPTGKITKITIHHMAGNVSIESCGAGFASPIREGSSNYGIGTDGRVGLYVDEKHRAWTSSSPDNDYKAVTIEVANDGGDPDWHVSDKAYAKLIDLCVDICKRNGISKLNYTGDATGNLTRHNMFAATICPGPYLQSKFNDIAKQVNKKLSATINSTSNVVNNKLVYKVQVGAYSSKKNAEQQLAKIKKAGFDACIIQVNGVYKIQVGAYGVKTNAESALKKVKKAGFNAFITTLSSSNKSNVDMKLKIGDKVRIKLGSYVYGTKTKFNPFIYASILYVRDINGDKVTVSTKKSGAITGSVAKDDLRKI